MSGRERLRWAFWPPGASLLASGFVTISLTTVAIADLYDSPFADSRTDPTPLGFAVVVMCATGTFIGTSHLVALVRTAWRRVGGNETVMACLGWVLLLAVSASVAVVSFPDDGDGSPPPMAPGGLTVLTTAPLDHLTMRVTRDTVGIGDPDRQVWVRVTFDTPVSPAFQIALLGSGASAFDQAALLRSSSFHFSSADSPSLEGDVSRMWKLTVDDGANVLKLDPSTGEVLTRNDGVEGATVLAPWYVPGDASLTVTPRFDFQPETGDDEAQPAPTSDAEPSEGAVFKNFTLEFALRLTHPSVGRVAGDLGDVGCPSGLDSVARAQTSAEPPEGLFAIPDATSKSGPWQVPQRCDVDVVVGELADRPVFLNGTRTGGAGTTRVGFTGQSSRQESPVAGIDTLTLASTSYWVPVGRRAGNEAAWQVALGLSTTAFSALLATLAAALWRRARVPAAGSSSNSPPAADSEEAPAAPPGR